VQVGSLVQLGPNYKNRNRWAIVSKSEDWSSHCTIVFTDTCEKVEAIKSGLIVYSNLENKNASW
jgi:hypothetical protein